MAWDLPLIIDPPDTICFQINVPNERFHLAAFYGAMYLLTRWYAWKPDSAHTGRLVGKVWMRIFDRLIGGNCTIPPKQGTAGAEGDENMIRQNPDNPCELQTSIDGINWCTFADLSLCFGAPAQPGNGTPQPQPGGGCVTYHGNMGAQAPWYLPTLVSDGDTVSVTNLDGSWNGGDLSRWYCPDGERFVAGACIGLGAVDGGDPLPTVDHMALIGLIGSTYFDLSSGPITIAGVGTSQQMTFQPNDSNLSDNAGDISFNVQVCNNQSAPFTHVIDFTAHPGGFTNDAAGTPAGTWDVSAGWVASEFILSGDHYWGLGIQLTIPSTIITSIHVPYSYAIGQHAGPDIFSNELALNGSGVDIQAQPATGDGSLQFNFSGSTAVTNITIIIVTAKDGGSTPSPTGTAVIPQMTIQGIGVDPF